MAGKGLFRKLKLGLGLVLSTFFLVSTAEGAYQLTDYNVNDSTSVTVNGSENSSSKITLTVGYRVYKSQYSTTEYEDRGGVGKLNGYNYGTSSSDTFRTEGRSYWNAFFSSTSGIWAIVSPSDFPEPGNGESKGYAVGDSEEFDGIGAMKGNKVVIHVTSKIYKGPLGGTHYGYGYVTYKSPKLIESATDLDSQMTVTLPSGSTLPQSTIMSNLPSPYSTYALRGFCLANDSTILPTDYQFTEDATIYVVLTDPNLYNSSGSQTGQVRCRLGHTISSKESGSYTFRVGAADEAYDISKDATYSSRNITYKTSSTESVTVSSPTVYLGVDANGDNPTIASGVVVNFALNDGSLNVANPTNKSSYSNFEPENGFHTPQYTVVLQSDFVVSGELYIGGEYGNKNSASTQGHIVDRFVTLDLNGYTLTVESTGFLMSYGLIKDSMGTGEIVVNGGRLKTLATIADYRGGGITYQMAQNGNTFPFSIYQIPYLRCSVRFRYSGSSCGRFEALANICAATRPSTKIVDVDLNFIGGDSTYLFQLPSTGIGGKDPEILVRGYEYQPMVSSLNETSSIVYQCMAWRFEIDLVNANFSMNGIKVVMEDIVGTYDVDISTKGMNFPISGFFDIKLTSAQIVIAQRIRMMPGSSLVADENSTIVLSHDSEAVAQISVLDKAYRYYEKNTNVTTDSAAVYTRALNSDGKTYTTTHYGVQETGSIYTNTTYCRYFYSARVKVFGDLVFVTGNSGSSRADYVLAGPMDFNKIGYRTSATGATTYIDYSSGENPFSKLQRTVNARADSENNSELRTKIVTQGFDLIPGSAYYNMLITSGGRNAHGRGFSRPLYSNGLAYIETGDGSGFTGTWDDRFGIVTTVNDEKYFFDCSNSTSWATDDKAGVAVRKATSVASDGVITYTDTGNTTTRYLRYASMYFVVSKFVSDGLDSNTYDYLLTIPSRLVESSVQFYVNYNATFGRYLRARFNPYNMSTD